MPKEETQENLKLLPGSVENSAEKRSPSCCCGVVGAGNSAHALASYLAKKGHRVSLYARNQSKIAHLQAGKVRASGQVEGEFDLEWVGCDPAGLSGCQYIFVCTTADAYLSVVAQLGPHLQASQNLILFSSKLGGCLEVGQALVPLGRRAPQVMETDALFACRLQSDHSVWVRGLKRWNLYSARRRSEMEHCTQVMKIFFPDLEPADNVIQRGLTDFGALAHALTVIVNMNAVDRSQPFLFYYEGYTERTVPLLEKLAQEFRNIALAYDTSLISASELLNRYYGCQTSSLLEAMKSVPNYRHSMAPESLRTRYLSEDVACTLVPAQELADRAGVETPVLDSVVTMASVLAGVDYRKSGRRLEHLGWGDLGAREIRQWMSW